jgi:chaperonin GroES
MNVQPLADRVAIKPHPDEETKKGSIIMLAGSQVYLPSRGEVVAVGPGRITDDGARVPLRVQLGDRVLFPRGQGVPCEVAGEACVLLFDTEIYGTYDGEVQSGPKLVGGDGR